MAAQFRRAFPTSLVGLCGMLAVDLLLLVLCLRFVGLGPGEAPLVDIAIAYLFAYPFTLFPFSGLGIVDALILAALVESGGADVEATAVAGLIVWRVFTLAGPVLMGVAALAHWRRTVARGEGLIPGGAQDVLDRATRMARMTRAILRTTSAVSSSATIRSMAPSGTSSTTFRSTRVPSASTITQAITGSGRSVPRSAARIASHHVVLGSQVALPEPRSRDDAQHVAGPSLQQVGLDQCVEDLGAQLPGPQLHDPGADAALAGRPHDQAQHLVEHRVTRGLGGQHPDPVAAVEVDLDALGDAEVGEHGAGDGVVHEALRPQVPARHVARRHQRVGLGDVQTVRSRAPSAHRALPRRQVRPGSDPHLTRQ